MPSRDGKSTLFVTVIYHFVKRVVTEHIYCKIKQKNDTFASSSSAELEGRIMTSVSSNVILGQNIFMRIKKTFYITKQLQVKTV